MVHPFLLIVGVIISNLIINYAYRFMIISLGLKKYLNRYLFWGYFSAFKIIPKFIKLMYQSYGEKIFKTYLFYLILFMIGFLTLIIEVYYFALMF